MCWTMKGTKRQGGAISVKCSPSPGIDLLLSLEPSLVLVLAAVAVRAGGNDRTLVERALASRRPTELAPFTAYSARAHLFL